MPYVRDRRRAIKIKIKNLIRLNSEKSATHIWVSHYPVATLEYRLGDWSLNESRSH